MRLPGRFVFAALLAMPGPVLQAPSSPSQRHVREVNQPPSASAAVTVAIVGATLIDGRGGVPITDAVVVVRGNRIVAVGRRQGAVIPPGAVLVDAAGMSVLPGLIDAHFHLDGDQGLPSLYLQHGVTSVRDPGAWIEAYDSVRMSDGQIPRLFLAGPHLDQAPPAYPEDAFLVRDADETRAAVNRLIDQGASVIKVYFRLPPSLIVVAVQTAAARGVPVTAHLETVDATVAIRAGISGIEHVTSLGTALLPPREAERYRQSVLENNEARQNGRYQVFSQLDLTTERTRRVVGLMASRGVFLSPTLAVFESRTGDRGADEAHVHGFQQMLALTGIAKRAGVKVVVGSHSSVPHAERGWAFQREMELLVEAGLTPLEAITAGTLDNARFFRVTDRLGVLAAGKTADLLLVEGRPDEDISALRRIKRVMLNGRWVAGPTAGAAGAGSNSGLQTAAPAYDLLIRHGTVIDGSGAVGTRADVAIVGQRIVRVSTGALDPATGKRVIDATGLTVSPGFIDLHAHLEPLLQLPSAESHLRQGVTLALGGPDGGGPWPFGAYLDSADRVGLGMNVAYLAGHNTIRRTVMGTDNRAPTAGELARMRAMVARAMDEGAFGLSTGLRYVPGTYANTDEVVALAREAATRGGIYTSHLREEGVGLLDGVAEALDIGRRATIPVVLTHHKAVGVHAWGKSVTTLAMVDSARQAGVDVMIDQYPYTASFTGLDVLIPPWALAGGTEALRTRLATPALRDSITRGIIDLVRNDRGGGDLHRVQFAMVEWDRSLQGKTLYDWAIARGMPATPESAVTLILEGVLKGGAGMVYHVIDEGDVQRIMAHPQTMIASDGRLTRLGDGVPHPRNYGTFPRVLGRYVRELHVLTLEQAVHKMTGMPAARLGLGDRGCVRVGCVADLTLFNAATVSDVGTFTDPHHYPEGIPWVLVNGVPVVANGALTSARPGRVVRRGR